MLPHSHRKRLLLLGTICCIAIATAPRIRAAAPPQVAVNAKTYNGYARARLPDGSLKPEYYTMAEGGRWNYADAESVDAITLTQLAAVMTGTLESQKYLPARDAAGADLMIVVFWGSTKGSEDGEYTHELSMASDTLSTRGISSRQPAAVGVARQGAMGEQQSGIVLNQLEIDQRNANNARNARILGYYNDFARGMSEFGNGTWRGQDAITEVESNRYFVVLKAYDAQVSLKEKKLKLLWEARFSIYERGYDFGEQLPAMIQVAARYFGKDSKGLVRADPPEGRVKVGEATVVPSRAPASSGR